MSLMPCLPLVQSRLSVAVAGWVGLVLVVSLLLRWRSAERKKGARAMTKTVIVRDYAFAETDPRFRGIHSTPEEIERQLIKDRSVSPSVSGPNKQTSHSYLQNKQYFRPFLIMFYLLLINYN